MSQTITGNFNFFLKDNALWSRSSLCVKNSKSGKKINNKQQQDKQTKCENNPFLLEDKKGRKSFKQSERWHPNIWCRPRSQCHLAETGEATPSASLGLRSRARPHTGMAPRYLGIQRNSHLQIILEFWKAKTSSR